MVTEQGRSPISPAALCPGRGRASLNPLGVSPGSRPPGGRPGAGAATVVSESGYHEQGWASMAGSDGTAGANGGGNGGGNGRGSAGANGRQADRQGGGEGGASAELIDDAIRLVDTLQRKLIIAGVRKGVSTVASPPPRTGDVWEQAIREEQAPQEAPLDRLAGVVRTAAPEVAGHLGRAGVTLFGALQESWQIAGEEFARQRREREEREEREAAERRARDERAPEAPQEITEGRD